MDISNTVGNFFKKVFTTKNFLFFGFFILSFFVFAGEVSAANWYVRPSGGSYGLANGTSYDNAWNGFASIVWGTGGVTAGDTLWLDGSATYSERLNIATSGTSGNPITIDGGYGGGKAIINKIGDYCIVGNDRNYLTIKNIEARNGLDAIVLFYKVHDLVFQNSSFNTSTSSYMLKINAPTGYDSYNIDIIDNDFSNATSSIGVHFSHLGNTFYNVNILRNTADSLAKFVRVYGSEEQVGIPNIPPYHFHVEDNVISNTKSNAISINSGLKSYGGTSYIRNNTLTNIGDGSVAQNAFELSWFDSVVIENNIVNTSTGDGVSDGHGMAISNGFGSDTYLSANNIIRNNIFSGCTSATYSSGFSIWRGINNQIYNNISYNNHVGFKNSNALNTGNVFYNNSAYNNSLAGFRFDTTAATATLKNNIFSSSQYGNQVTNTVSIPTLSNNVFYNNSLYDRYNAQTASTFSAGSGSVSSNPSFSNSTLNVPLPAGLTNFQ